jgi:3-dehydro-L-gulonate 2-dehydrogenase
MRVPFQQLHDTLRGVLENRGMQPPRADLCARLFAETSRDGVYSHGLNRFPRFIRMIDLGVIDVSAEAACVAAHRAIERWDGHRGPGNLNAYACMDRAIALAREYGVGCVALSNTNHWMRGGTYGWQAADAGAIGICWTNTLANLPPWGAPEPRVGNNPLIIAIPRPAGHIVLDMAMSQFSVGALSQYAARGEALPVAGGYDEHGELSRDAAAIERTRRLLPIGFWKGSGLALALDAVAAVLSGGRATVDISPIPERESDLSQVFIAIDVSQTAEPAAASALLDAIIAFTQQPSVDSVRVRYPGERTLETRRRNMQEGILVDEQIWRQVVAMAG